MSKLQDLIDADEMGYQFAMFDIRNAIDTYGIEILKDALSNYYPRDLTNLVIPDTMLVQ